MHIFTLAFHFFVLSVKDLKSFLKIAVETFRHYTCSAAAADEAQLRSVLESSAERYLSQDMIAGRIVQKREHLIKGDGYCSLDGHYVCMEMIGIVRQEQIGEYNGKDS